MAKFIYKMQNILNIKYKLEEQAKTEYSICQSKLNQEEKKLNNLYDRKLCYEDKLRGKISTSLNIMEIKSAEEAIETIKVLIRYQMIEVKQAEQRLEIARIKLNDSMVERKTQEKLKENAFEIFKQEINSEETKEVDELVSYKFNNVTSNEGDE